MHILPLAVPAVLFMSLVECSGPAGFFLGFLISVRISGREVLVLCDRSEDISRHHVCCQAGFEPGDLAKIPDFVPQLWEGIAEQPVFIIHSINNHIKIIYAYFAIF
jgi:hypothetical protein